MSEDMIPTTPSPNSEQESAPDTVPTSTPSPDAVPAPVESSSFAYLGKVLEGIRDALNLVQQDVRDVRKEVHGVSKEVQEVQKNLNEHENRCQKDKGRMNSRIDSLIKGQEDLKQSLDDLKRSMRWGLGIIIAAIGGSLSLYYFLFQTVLEQMMRIAGGT